MKHLRSHLVTAGVSHAPLRSAGKSTRTETICVPDPAFQQQEPIEHCYRTLLETSSDTILLLSSESLILEWNRAAEILSGWMADETLGHSYVELCLPPEARESFLSELARAEAGIDVRGHASPLQSRVGISTMLSWNFSRVMGTRGHLIGLMAIGTIIASHTRVEEELRLAHARLHGEARRAQIAAEEERRRIARELHDEFGQALTGLKFDLAWLGMKVPQSPAPVGGTDLLTKVEAMSGSIDALLESVRHTVAALRPPMLDDLGLIPALECLATTFHHRTGACCAVDVSPESLSIELPFEVSAALFRIAQELLTNVMRHATASHVRVGLYQSKGTVTLEVSDNGKGITRERMMARDSFGLRGMQERASLLGGHFHIVGTSGIGTTARASVPVTDCRAQ